jgi:GntR family transcriptional regulator
MTPDRPPAKRNAVAAKTPSLKRDSPEPLHRQLAALLEDAIRSGGLKPGDRLDSESMLTARYGVSRITLRQAVGALVDKQILVRKQGKGTFVTAPAVRHDLRKLHGLLGSLFAQAEGASTRLLRYELRRPTRAIARELGLSLRGKALLLERLYLIDGAPVALTEAWLVPGVAALPRLKAELTSTEDMMRETGIRIVSTRVSIRAEAAGARVGRQLKISAQAPVLVFGRRALGADGNAKEVGRMWFCSERYQFVCASDGAAPANLFDIQDLAERAGS